VGGGYEPHTSFLTWVFSCQTKIVLKTITFKLQPLILNRCLPNMFRSDHLSKTYNSFTVYIFCMEASGSFEPPCFICYLNGYPWAQIVLLNLPFKLALQFKLLHLNEMIWGKMLNTPIFVKMRPLVILWETYTLIWLVAPYSESMYTTHIKIGQRTIILSKVIAVYIFCNGRWGFWLLSSPPHFFIRLLSLRTKFGL